jgi:hypothetical protein
MEDAEQRIADALIMATWGAVDGDHHKMWAIDQMVRALTGCPDYGNSFGESPEYLAWVAEYEGDDGSWDTGTPP